MLYTENDFACWQIYFNEKLTILTKWQQMQMVAEFSWMSCTSLTHRNTDRPLPCPEHDGNKILVTVCLLRVTFVEINSAWVGLSEQLSSTNWGPSWVTCKCLMKRIIFSLMWFASLPCTNASCKTCRLERNTLEMLFSSKKYLSKWCLAQQKHCPRLCLSCFQLLQMVSSNIWGRLQS